MEPVGIRMVPVNMPTGANHAVDIRARIETTEQRERS